MHRLFFFETSTEWEVLDELPIMRIRYTIHSENTCPPLVFCSMSRNNIFLRSKGVDESSDFVNKRTGDVAPAGCSYNNVPCLCDMCIKKHIYIYIMNTCIHPFISISYTNCSSYCTLNLLQRRVSIDSATIRILKGGERVRRRSVVYEHMHIHAQKFQHFFGGSCYKHQSLYVQKTEVLSIKRDKWVYP